MGLDSVELVLAFEEAFGVAIEDAAAEKMITPRHVIDYIVQCRGVGTKKLCVTRSAFHRIRGQFMRIGVERSAIRPGTPLAQFFPEDTRRSLWVQARGQLASHQWPDLVRSGKLRRMIAIAPLLIASAVFVWFVVVAPSRGILGSFTLAIVLAACISLLLHRVTRKQCRYFPGITTVRDLIIRVTAGRAANLLWKHEEFTRAEIASTVKLIVIEQLGIRESDYGEDKEFVRDLGME